MRRTHIQELDRLLGLGEPNAFAPGRIVLVRGAPGTGKTTLCLQILNQYVKHESGGACLLSLETDPERALELAHKSFAFSELCPGGSTNPRIQRVSRNDLELALASRHERERPSGEAGESVASKVSSIVDPPWVPDRGTSPKKRSPTETTIADYLQKLAGPSAHRGLVIIDSLNVFVDVLRFARGDVSATIPSGDLRGTLFKACHAIQRAFHQAVVILTSEYHGDGSGIEVSESFLCDTLIALSAEPVKPGAEVRNFCRVLKCRDGQNQLRRCCYDIVGDRGFAFYETYPGDGRVLFFHENERQTAIVDEMFNKDFVQLFPSLQGDRFDRSNLHHVLANKQRLRNVPERNDLYLATFDTYWVNWYVEQAQREYVRFALLQAGADSAPERLSPLVGALHRYALRPRGEPDADKKMPAYLDDATRASETKIDIRALAQTIDGQMAKAEHQAGIFELIERRSLRPLGRQQWDFIEELKRQPHRVPGNREDLLRSVPFSLNVGLRLMRTDLRDHLVDEAKKVLADRRAGALIGPDMDQAKATKKVDEDMQRLINAESSRATEHWSRRQQQLLEEEQSNQKRRPQSYDVEERAKQRLNDELRDRVLETEVRAELRATTKRICAQLRLECGVAASELDQREDELIDQHDPLNPKTWEEMVALCELSHQVPALEYQLALECATFDTLMVTLLEILWAHGAELVVRPDYTIENWEETERALTRSLALFQYMIKPKAYRGSGVGMTPLSPGESPTGHAQKTILPRESTLEVRRFAERYRKSPGAYDWLFCRHWYSTLVDHLTSKITVRQGADRLAEEFVLDDRKSRIRIDHLPTTVYSLARGGPEIGRSCLGEWHLVLGRGSENRTLGLELINWILNGQTMCDWAFRSAILPTVDAFYDIYGDASCLNLERNQLLSGETLTFRRVRQMARGGGSRSTVFDYRLCMRPIHGIVEAIRAQTLDWPAIRDKIRKLPADLRELGGAQDAMALKGMTPRTAPADRTPT